MRGRKRRGPAGPPGHSPSSSVMTQAAVICNMFGKGRASGTFSFLLGGTATITVTLDRTFAGDFVAVGEIASQTTATLGLGVVAIKEARRKNNNQIDVTVTSNSVLSNVTIEVVAIGVGM